MMRRWALRDNEKECSKVRLQTIRKHEWCLVRTDGLAFVLGAHQQEGWGKQGQELTTGWKLHCCVCVVQVGLLWWLLFVVFLFVVPITVEDFFLWTIRVCVWLCSEKCERDKKAQREHFMKKVVCGIFVYEYWYFLLDFFVGGPIGDTAIFA